MPVFAVALLAERNSEYGLWVGLLLLMLGCRDGLLLIIAWKTIDLTFRRRWRWSLAAWGMSIGCLLMISGWLYLLLRDGEDPKAASQMYGHLNG